MNKYIVFVLSCTFFLSCSSTKKEHVSLTDALTLYASFDQNSDCDFAMGDKKLYTTSTSSTKDRSDDVQGIGTSDVSIAEGKGHSGGNALHFLKKSKQVPYYKGEKNINYSQEDWSGTVSFWMKTDPVNGLEPGFTDPIQITDEEYNDAAIWVDFSDKNPRKFRLGVIGDVAPRKVDSTYQEPVYLEKVLISMDKLPFSLDEWTHILIKYENLNTAAGKSGLYINGKLHGSRNDIQEAFTWNEAQVNIFLGYSFVGLIDELSIYDKALSDEEIAALYQLGGGLKAIL